jgi:hypothetical protein
MDKSPETPAQHLLRSMTITSSARFNASRRLGLHQDVSLWAVSVFSVVLIVVPLLEPFGVEVNLNSQLVNLLNVVAAIIILVISILVNSSNFAERAEKMHRCALELNGLAREVELRIQEHGPELTSIRDLQTRYDDILARYENHTDVDFRVAQAKKAPTFYGIGWKQRVRLLGDTARALSLYFLLIATAMIYLIILVF